MQIFKNDLILSVILRSGSSISFVEGNVGNIDELIYLKMVKTSPFLDVTTIWFNIGRRQHEKHYYEPAHEILELN